MTQMTTMVIIHLEPDILECKVKWALGIITANKARGGDRIPAELFWILKHDSVKVLHSICQQIWKTLQWPQDWKRSVSMATSNKGDAKECSNYCSNSRLQKYVNQELPEVQAGFRRGRGTRDQIAKICWIMEKVREYHKNIYLYFIDYAKALDCVDHNKLENCYR